MCADHHRGWTHSISVDLTGRPVVVIGGGTVAEKRIGALIEAGAQVTVVSPAVTDRVARWADAGRVALKLRAYQSGDLHGASLVYAATSDLAVNRAVRVEAQTEGIWLNAVDQPELCDFITPAIVRRGSLTIAISTNGRCPSLSHRIREDLERQFGPEYAAAVEHLGDFRERWKAAGGAEEGLEHEVATTIEALRSARSEVDAGSSSTSIAHVPNGDAAGKVYLVGAGPGDPDLLTVKGRRVLERADTVVYDALVDQRLLDLCRPDAARIYVGKREGHHSRPQAEINVVLVKEARARRVVVRLKGGDPFVFGRGGEEAEALRHAGVDYEVVPGVSAGIAVPAYAGIPLTHRDVVSEVVFLTGHECVTNPSPVDWSQYARSAATLVIFMGLHNLGAIAQHLIEHGRSRSCPVAVIENGTTAAQRTIVASLARIAAEAAAADVRPPAVIVVGEVVRLRERLQWFDASVPAR